MRTTIFGLISILFLAVPPAALSARRGKVKMSPEKKKMLVMVKKVYEARIAFAEGEITIWRTYWKKVRDQRGQFSMRMEKQRDGFVDSLRSLDSEFHYSSLQDFENLQGNMVRSFEEDQSARIQEFMALRESNLRDFGIAQESERARLEGASVDAWIAAKKALHIEPISEEELEARGKGDKKKKKRKSRRKKKKRKMKVHRVN